MMNMMIEEIAVEADNNPIDLVENRGGLTGDHNEI